MGPVQPNRPFDLGAAIRDALALHQQGRLDEAEKIYTRVLKARRDQFDALNLLGMLKLQRGKAGEAYRLLTAALAVEPRSADALTNLGLVLHALKRDAEALASFDNALAIAPDHVEALNNRGRALLELGRSQEALACFERVLALQPRHIEARINHGNALAGLGRPEQAIDDYDAAIAVHPAHPGAHFNRGNALAQLARHADAIAAFDRAVAIWPVHAKAWSNRGLALAALNRPRDAVASYDRALAIDTDLADAHFNRALALLALGDFRGGFRSYEWRWQRSGMPAPRRFGQPLWLGEYPLGRRTILLHAEQGLGDALQFVRYAKPLARAGARIVLEAQPELAGLLAQVEGVDAVIPRGAPLPAFDVHCPLASLPLALTTEPATIPAEIPYLSAPEERVAEWRPRIESLERPRIAIAWAGSPAHANDRNRSMALAQLAPLIAAVDARFVSVQCELRGDDPEAVQRTDRLTDLGPQLVDFADTAAVISLVDLVISVDTAVAHLAAAMGRQTWIMLPFAADWRWMLDRGDSPWYPTARLFRQPVIGDWDAVIAQLCAAWNQRP